MKLSKANLLISAALIVVGVTLIMLTITTVSYLATVASQDESFHLAPEDSPSYSRTQDHDKYYPYDALVRLVSNEKHKNRTFCSGTVISDNYVLTAAHCLTQQGLLHSSIRTQEFTVVGQTALGERSPPVYAKAIAIDSAADYALVQGDFAQFSRVAVQDKPYLYFDMKGPIIVCGFPHNSDSTCYPTGNDPATYEHLMKIGGRLFPGMSGGPALDAGSGRIIGVNSANGDGYIVIAPIIGLFDDLGIKVSDK